MGGLFAKIGYGARLLWARARTALSAVSISATSAIKKRRMHGQVSEAALKIQEEAPYTDEQLENLNRILADTGYAFDWQQNIYYSVVDPWQRKLGYCSLYDEWAVPLGMVFDSEPVRFEYNGKRWLIEFWKGQYGITSGGEIGIYNTTEPDVDIPGIFTGTFYRSASDEEAMNMTFTLSRGGAPMFTRKDRHWWLTGFVLGEYVDPSELIMEASLTFDDPGLRDAFLAALRELYAEHEISLSENTVSFTFAEPRSEQPSSRSGLINSLALLRLKLFVAEYKRLTGGLTNMDDILTNLKVKSPTLYNLVMRMGRQKEQLRFFDTIRKYLK